MPLNSEDTLCAQLSQGITKALHTLLVTKHLYQSTEVHSDFLSKYVERAGRSGRSDAERRGPGISFSGGGGLKQYVENAERSAAATAKSLTAKVATLRWQPKPLESDTPGPVQGSDAVIPFELPTIQTFCPTCEARWPFNPGTNAKWGSLRAAEKTLSAFIPSPPSTPAEQLAVALIGDSYETHQLFLFPYQCQQCKGAPVSFLVRRSRFKLTLCGREPLETVEVPACIPKLHRKHFSGAVIAHHAGQTLAGLFLLRTFIEQFWHSLNLPPQIEGARMTGDERGEAYNRTLPDDFKSRFPSLSNLYGRLSAAMHSANADSDLFKTAVNEITEHFDARRLFKLDASAIKTCTST